jgi:peptidyl-prolyl cis-trans isomerase-like protein 2
VFGRVVGGLDTLSALERVETDNKDRPIEDLVIERCLVFVDPFAEVDEQVIMRINRQFLAIQIWFDFI